MLACLSSATYRDRLRESEATAYGRYCKKVMKVRPAMRDVFRANGLFSGLKLVSTVACAAGHHHVGTVSAENRRLFNKTLSARNIDYVLWVPTAFYNANHSKQDHLVWNCEGDPEDWGDKECTREQIWQLLDL